MAYSKAEKTFAIFATIAFLLCVLNFFAPISLTVSAKEGYYSSYDENHTYTKGELSEIADDFKTDIETVYGKLPSGYTVDENSDELQSVLSSVKAKIEEMSENKLNDYAREMLGENRGLKGIKNIAETAVGFYEYYVSESGEFYSIKRNDYSESNWNSIVEKAKNYFKGFALSGYRTDYSGDKAKEYYDAFEGTLLEENQAQSKLNAAVDELIAKITDEYETYQTEKYDADTVKKYVTSSDFDKAKADLEKCKGTTETAAKKVANDFLGKFIGIPTYVEVKNAEYTERENTVRNMSSDSESRLTLKDEAYVELLKDFEETYSRFYSLDESLQSEKDKQTLQSMTSLYRKVAKDDVSIKADIRDARYGKSAESVISENKSLAGKIIDSINSSGQIADSYSYRKNGYNTVKVASDVVKAFYDSYEVSGALSYNGTTSKAAAEKKSRVTYSDDKYEITVESYSKSGSVITDFDSTARLTVREGAAPSIKRNINVILSRDDLEKFISSNLGYKDAIINEVKGKHLHAYFKIDVYENDVIREDFDAIYEVTVKFKTDEKVAEFSGGLNVINYYHTEITGFVASEKITMDGNNVMVFKTENFSEFAILSGVEWMDLAKWILIGVIGVIALSILATIIIALVRNRKFTIVFDANGGRANRYVKVKRGEKFSYPKNPVRSGYVFMGWFTTKKCETRFASTELLDRKKVTVYAKWITQAEYDRLSAENTTAKNKSALDKAETEKLEYELKKAEEARKTEEIRQQTVQQIEESKKNEEAREQAEREAEEAKAQLAEAIAEKEELERKMQGDGAPTESGELNLVDLFDKLKAEIYSYEKANDLPYGLEENVAACAMRIDGDTIVLEVNIDFEEAVNKGYIISKGDKLSVKKIIASEEDYAEAEELIEETMYENGFKKTRKAVVTESTAETREQGFEYGFTYERKAETAEEFLKLIRVHAKSFVMAEEGEFEEKALMKTFVGHGRVYIYLNYEGEGMDACDDAMKAEGYKSFVVVRNAEECAVAIGYITKMMRANGLVRFPVDSNIAEEGSDKGFTYTLKR